MTTPCKKCKCEKDCPQQLCIACRKTTASIRRTRVYREKDYQSRRWAHRVCVHSRLTDKKKQRIYTKNEYITPDRLKQMREIQDNKCIYCKCEMQTDNMKAPDGLTIERLWNDLPHTIPNCVLCCSHCNLRTKHPGNHKNYPIIHYCFRELLEKVKPQ